MVRPQWVSVTAYERTELLKRSVQGSSFPTRHNGCPWEGVEIRAEMIGRTHRAQEKAGQPEQGIIQSRQGKQDRRRGKRMRAFIINFRCSKNWGRWGTEKWSERGNEVSSSLANSYELIWSQKWSFIFKKIAAQDKKLALDDNHYYLLSDIFLCSSFVTGDKAFPLTLFISVDEIDNLRFLLYR